MGIQYNIYKIYNTIFTKFKFFVKFLNKQTLLPAPLLGDIEGIELGYSPANRK